MFKNKEEFNVTGGRDAFRSSNINKGQIIEMDEEKKIHAMKSFTQSIDMDLPPMPELPPNLDIDKFEGFGMSLSSTQDTIIECTNKNSGMGETQKYAMTVPGPGHTDQEQEQHTSLLKEEDDDGGSLEEEKNIESQPFRPSTLRDDSISKEIRREYSVKARPRPTTPIQTSVLESFIANSTINNINSNNNDNVTEKITVKLPKIKNEDDPFVSSTTTTTTKKSRRISINKNNEGDILSDNEEFKSKAPAHPVVHRRASIEWENFVEKKEELENLNKDIKVDNNEINKNEEIITENVESNNITDTSYDDYITYSEDKQYYLADDGEWYPISALTVPNEQITYEDQYYSGEITYSEDGQYYLADDGQWYPVSALEDYQQDYNYDETTNCVNYEDPNIYSSYSNEQPLSNEMYPQDSFPQESYIHENYSHESYSENKILNQEVYSQQEEHSYNNEYDNYSYDQYGKLNYTEKEYSNDYKNDFTYEQYGSIPKKEEEENVSTSIVTKSLFTDKEIGDKEKDPYGWEEEEKKVVEISTKAPPPRPTTGPTPIRPPPPNKTPEKKVIQEPEVEEDAWTKFNAMSSQITSIVKNTEEKLKDLSNKSAINDIKDESYLASVGGSQPGGNINLTIHKKILEQKEKETKDKADKKLKSHLGIKDDKKKKKKKGSDLFEYEYDVEEEDEMDRKAAELADKLGAMRQDVGEWKKPEILEKKEIENTNIDFKVINNWTGFEEGEDKFSTLSLSNSDFFNNIPKTAESVIKEIEDPFAVSTSIKEETKDLFDVPDADKVIQDLENKVEEKMIGHTGELDYLDDFDKERKSNVSTPTQEGGSPVSRPIGFEDEFNAGDVYYSHTPTPLFDDDDKEPLSPFKKDNNDSWNLMIRHPLKKKLMADRVWKTCYVKLERESLSISSNNSNEHMMLKIYQTKGDSTPILEILLQPTYSLSDSNVQPYDAYGKIHTVKLQQITYKEKVGIRQGQISRLVEGHLTKFGMPIEHSASVNVLAKFGSLDHDILDDFVNKIEDILFKCECKRSTKPIHKQDEVQIHCYDEYIGSVDVNGCLKSQKARVRMFCLAFLTGSSPYLEIGLNDKRRQGKEIVRRKDILPMYTERWIKFENIEFHSSIDQEVFVDEHYLKLSPPDGVFFEIMRFRIRPPKNKERPIIIKSLMKIAGSAIEIRIEVMVSASTHKHKNRDEETRIIPCEDIQIRFPIPEAWIYLFREERTWGVGSIHSKTRRPGKVKNLKDKIIGAVTQTSSSMIEVAIGEAKYEHLYRSLVWRIPRLPEKHHEAYKNHLLTCRFELSSFDLMPEAFMPSVDVEFTMPLSTVSSTVVRSIGIEGHEDSDRVEKFVRYVSKYNYKFEIDYFHCDSLECERTYETNIIKTDEHQTMFTGTSNEANEDKIKFDKIEEIKIENDIKKDDDSSSDSEDEKKRNVPMIHINMKGFLDGQSTTNGYVTTKESINEEKINKNKEDSVIIQEQPIFQNQQHLPQQYNVSQQYSSEQYIPQQYNISQQYPPQQYIQQQYNIPQYNNTQQQFSNIDIIKKNEENTKHGFTPLRSQLFGDDEIPVMEGYGNNDGPVGA
ncbi:Protein stoned-B [Strongyloides ratti]|uniref:Protein stoned-B n=1 Tax=Strongyloides ratti TaxID=34506 RepID=A0A090KWG7_STRRB|nr:Protein stoned-B [Strongyloides ratti]CEF61741.1 Protein stoned-B [Strongyloides ratti]